MKTVSRIGIEDALKRSRRLAWFDTAQTESLPGRAYIPGMQGQERSGKAMSSPDRNTTSSECSAQLLAWVTSAYQQALRLYGPAHPLTRSWLTELRDVKWFAAHLKHDAGPGA